MNYDFVTLTLRLDHPTAPVLLTKNGPHVLSYSFQLQQGLLLKRQAILIHLQFENELRSFQSHSSQSFALPDETILVNYSYPQGNFDWNQLLDSSISLSPLYSTLTIDLHVRIATGLHQAFTWLHPDQAQFTIFRVLTDSLNLTLPLLLQQAFNETTCLGFPLDFPSHQPSTWVLFVRLLNSLIRVSRRVDVTVFTFQQRVLQRSLCRPLHTTEVLALPSNAPPSFSFKVDSNWYPGSPSYEHKEYQLETLTPFVKGQFHILLTLSSKFFSTFPHGTCLLLALPPVFSFVNGLPQASEYNSKYSYSTLKRACLDLPSSLGPSPFL